MESKPTALPLGDIPIFLINMFLISWRGYWQELIETLVWAHDRLPIALWSEKPVALTIVQARFVGLIHFTVGYILTYAAFLIASTSGKFG